MRRTGPAWADSPEEYGKRRARWLRGPGRCPFGRQPPSLSPASLSEDDDPEDPENSNGKKEKKKRKSQRQERRRSKETKPIPTCEVNLPELTGKDLSKFAQRFATFMRITGQTHASGRVTSDLLLQSCKTKYLEKQVKQTVAKSATFANVLVALERQHPSYKTDLSIWTEIQILAMLPNNPKAARISELLADLDQGMAPLTLRSYGSEELLFRLVARILQAVWDECRATAERKARTLSYEDLSVLLLDLAPEKESDQHLNAYRPGDGKSGNHRCGYDGPRASIQGQTPKNPRYNSNVRDLFWCDTRDQKGGLVYAFHCNRNECFVVRGKKQETNAGGKAKMPDH